MGGAANQRNELWRPDVRQLSAFKEIQPGRHSLPIRAREPAACCIAGRPLLPAVVEIRKVVLVYDVNAELVANSGRVL